MVKCVQIGENSQLESTEITVSQVYAVLSTARFQNNKD